MQESVADHFLHALFRELLTSTDLYEFRSAWAGVSVFDIRCSFELSTADMDIAIIIQLHLGEHFAPTYARFLKDMCKYSFVWNGNKV